VNILPDKVQKLQEQKSAEQGSFLHHVQRFFLHRHFALLWTGSTISSFGSYITSIGLPIAALLLLHASPVQMGLLAALGALPGLLAGLFIGVWVDRLPRRPILLVADLGRALLLAGIPLVAISGHLNLAWFYVITLLTGLLTVCFEVASLSFLPTLLTPGDLATGNSRLGISASLAEITGPPLAGLLIQLLTAPLAILLDALSFLLSALCLSQIRLPEHVRTSPSAAHPHLWSEMHEGLSELLHNPVLRPMAAYICTHMFFGGAYAALYLLYTVQLFGATPFAYSALVALGGIGALIGSFCANACTRRFGRGRTLLGSVVLFGPLTFCTPLATGPLPVLFMLMALPQLFGDAAFAVYSISEISLRQALVPDHLLGRVNACMHILSTSVTPLGALLAGLLSELIGVRLTLLIGSSGIFLASAWLLFSPLRHYK
jgi:predicted MFS family arabinose efflux permease